MGGCTSSGRYRVTALLIFRGPPASGKSTAAESLRRHQGYTIVNRDSIRFNMYGRYFGGAIDEDVVTDVENAMVEASLRAGESVVLDATNLRNRNLNAKLSLASRYGADVSFRDFEVPLEQAIEWDKHRDRKVGEKVIRDFYKRYKISVETGVLKAPPVILPSFAPYVANTDLQSAYIVDTDGTVANHEPHRGPYDTSKYAEDTVWEHVAEVVRALYAEGHAIIGLSGRNEDFTDVTIQWWKDNNIPFDDFFFRPNEDGVKTIDATVKYNLFVENIAPNYNVRGAFDDRPQVVRMWETIGVPVLMVNDRREF